MSENRPDTGNYYPWMQKGADNQPDVDVISVAAVAGCGQRRTEARGKMQELLCYDPESVELAPRILQSCECDGFTRHVVLCPNAFYFGSQRLPTAPNGLIRRRWRHRSSEDADRAIIAFNRFAQTHEHVLAKYLFASGTTWPGVLFQGDRASLGYLLSRPRSTPTGWAAWGDRCSTISATTRGWSVSHGQHARGGRKDRRCIRTPGCP